MTVFQDNASVFLKKSMIIFCLKYFELKA